MLVCSTWWIKWKRSWEVPYHVVYILSCESTSSPSSLLSRGLTFPISLPTRELGSSTTSLLPKDIWKVAKPTSHRIHSKRDHYICNRILGTPQLWHLGRCHTQCHSVVVHFISSFNYPRIYGFEVARNLREEIPF